MKTFTFSMLMLVVSTGAGLADKPPLSEILKDALFAEEADRDFAEAEKGYREILRRFDGERAHAATAALRLAEVLNTRGETEEAEKLYARVLREFGDQKAVAEVAKERLGDKALVAGDAVAESRVNRLEKMLAESPDLLNTEVDGKTPLERAAEKGEADVVEYLIGKGVDVNGDKEPYLKFSKGSVPASPLAKAVAGGHLETVELLIGAGANLETGLLHVAAKGGHLAVTKTLLEHGMEIDTRFPSEALIAGQGDEKPSMPPVSRRRSVRPASATVATPLGSQSAWNLTALEVAVRQSFGEVARLLVDRGADVLGREGQPSTALIDAIDSGDRGLVDLLLANGAKANVPGPESTNPLFEAGRGGHAGIVKSLIAAGADVSWSNEHGATALHYAKGLAVDALIEAGADVNAMAEGWGAPLSSIDRRDAKAEHKVKALLAAGADPNLTGKSGNPPLVVAVANRLPGAVVALLAAGADVSLEGSYGSALSVAVGDLAMVERLLQAGADPNHANSRGYTAFYSAVGHGLPEVVQRLLKAGAKPNGVGGESPAPITALRDGLNRNGVSRESMDEIREAFGVKARLLVEAGADVNAVAAVEKRDGSSRRRSPRRMDNGMGEPVVFKAARWGDAELVHYLISKGAKLEAAGEHAYEVIGKGNEELRAEMVRAILLNDERRADVLRVVIAERGEILLETAPLGDEDCSYSIFEAFGFPKRNAHLSTGEAKIWRVGSDQPITVNLRELAAAADPAADIALQWGDVVEFREPKDDADGGFSHKELEFLRNHLKRSVTTRWVGHGGEEAMEMPTTFSLNSHSGINGSELSKPGYYPGPFHHLALWVPGAAQRPTAIGIAYLVPLLELGGRDQGGDFRPESWQLVRKGADGEELKGEFSDLSKPSPWIEDGDEIVFRGRVSIQNRNPARPGTPPRRRAVLPPSSR